MEKVKKPLVGIVLKTILHTDLDGDWQKQIVNDEIRMAVINNGGVPIGIIPAKNGVAFYGDDDGKDPTTLTVSEKDSLIAQISVCDGVILQGGMNSDKFEEWIAKYCFEKDIPTLGICSGLNNMVRGLGGLCPKHGNLELHRDNHDKYDHNITINKDSKLYEIIGKEKLYTNSIHSFAPTKVKDLTITAYADDGIAEAVEAKSKRFYVGVKFHPELLYLEDKFHNQIIKAFIKACK